MSAIVFLDPAVILEPLLYSRTGLAAAPFPNGNTDQLNRLGRDIGASLVITNTAGLGDVRARLHAQGLRSTSFHPVWVVDEAVAGIEARIAAWLANQGEHLHAVIGRPASVGPDALLVPVPVRCALPVDRFDAMVATLARQISPPA